VHLPAKPRPTTPEAAVARNHRRFLNLRRLLAFAAVLVVLVDCSLASSAGQSAAASTSDTQAAQYVYGTWYSYPLGNPETDAVRHQFKHNNSTNKDELIVTHMCQGSYRAVIARAVSPVVITQNTIRVMKAASDIEKGELNSECKISVEPGLWSYTMSDDHDRLTITNPGGSPDIMDLARQDAASGAALPSNVYGTWLLPMQSERDTQVQIKLIFYSGSDPTKGKVRQIATCSKGNDTLVSQADSEIRVSAQEIKIMSAASHVQRDGPFICKVTITPGTIHYELSPTGDIMTLTSAEGGGTLKLTRQANPGLN
jgi:hypothetical protein